jgi:folate-binding protein YgfZ
MNIDTNRKSYDAVLNSGGVIERRNRGLIEVTGTDRATWLNNLVTNVVKTLQSGEGNYAFCANVKGRIVFDLNMLVRDDAIWIDVDASWVEKAMSWFDRYIITEDVQLANRTAEQTRFGVVGPAAAATCESLKFGNLVPKAWLQHETRELQGAQVTMFRHDFVGLVGAEFIVLGESRDGASTAIKDAARSSNAVEMRAEVSDALRIEAGIPASVRDIDDEVIVAETGQIERGVSYQKGCYLGQEVVERMRSRGGLARKLVGLRIDGSDRPEKNATINAGDSVVGRVTSAAYSPALGSIVALGYMKIAHANAGAKCRIDVGGRPIAGEVVALPMRPA